jgi:hypothetical protein
MQEKKLILHPTALHPNGDALIHALRFIVLMSFFTPLSREVGFFSRVKECKRTTRNNQKKK